MGIFDSGRFCISYPNVLQGSSVLQEIAYGTEFIPLNTYFFLTKNFEVLILNILVIQEYNALNMNLISYNTTERCTDGLGYYFVILLRW